MYLHHLSGVYVKDLMLSCVWIDDLIYLLKSNGGYYIAGLLSDDDVEWAFAKAFKL